MRPETFDRLSRSLARASRRTVLCAALGAFTGFLLAPRQPAKGQDAAVCTLVELRPGYPGYRGFVTGLFGPGEAACLEDLAMLYPGFNRVAEDRENRLAARDLGIAGRPEAWVWENWLAIEAQRGRSPVCYLDAYRQIAAGAPFPQVSVPASDPRLRVGNIGSQEFVRRTAATVGAPVAVVARSFPEDYLLRAVAWTRRALAHANAPQIADQAEAFVWEMTLPGTSGAPYLAPLVRTQGGYFPVPTSACPDDQVFLALVTMATLFLVNSGPVGTAMMNEVESAATSWRGEVARGAQISLRDYLIAHVPGLP